MISAIQLKTESIAIIAMFVSLAIFATVLVVQAQPDAEPIFKNGETAIRTFTDEEVLIIDNKHSWSQDKGCWEVQIRSKEVSKEDSAMTIFLNKNLNFCYEFELKKKNGF